MKTFMSGVGAATVLFALTSFAYWSGHAAGVVPLARQQVGPIKISDLPLNRSFQAHFNVSHYNSPTTLTFPATAGIAITQLIGPSNFSTFIGVNGAQLRGGQGEIKFDPPIIVTPGSTLTLGTDNPFGPDSVTLGGWTLAPGDV